MKPICLLSALLLCAVCGFSQELKTDSNEPLYRQALGIKFPGGVSVTYKHYFNDRRNFEGQATFWDQGFRASGLYEFNFPVAQVEGLNLFTGPGIHAGTWRNTDKISGQLQADIGIDGIIGADYKFRDFPINVSLDWQPSVVIIGSAAHTPILGGLAVRYTF